LNLGRDGNAVRALQNGREYSIGSGKAQVRIGELAGCEWLNML
jgi:hypothetical protein